MRRKRDASGTELRAILINRDPTKHVSWRSLLASGSSGRTYLCSQRIAHSLAYQGMHFLLQGAMEAKHTRENLHRIFTDTLVHGTKRRIRILWRTKGRKNDVGVVLWACETCIGRKESMLGNGCRSHGATCTGVKKQNHCRVSTRTVVFFQKIKGERQQVFKYQDQLELWSLNLRHLLYHGGTLLRAAPEHMRLASRLGTDVSSANRYMTRLPLVTGEIIEGALC